MILQVISKMIQLLTNQIVYITQLFSTAIRNVLTIYIEQLLCLAMLLYYSDIFGRLSKFAGSILNILFKHRAATHALFRKRRLELPNYLCNVSDPSSDRIYKHYIWRWAKLHHCTTNTYFHIHTKVMSCIKLFVKFRIDKLHNKQRIYHNIKP